MAALLKITDGTTDIVLTQSTRPAAASGLHRATLDQGWLPKVAEYKQGGVWQDSPLSDNRTLATTQFQNVVESFQLNLRDAATALYPTGTSNASAQDLMIRALQEARRLLEKAAAYWTTSWQDEPVYLVAQAEYETNARYAILYRGSIPEDKDPYFQLFERVGDPMMLDLTCIVERGHWTANVPGTGVCVKTSNQQTWDYNAEWTLNVDPAGAGYIEAGLELSTGRMLMLEPVECWRSDNGAVWFAATTPPGLFTAFGSVLEAADGDVFFTGEDAANNTEIWRSQNAGVDWFQRNATYGSRNTHALAEFQGYIYMAILSLSVVNGIARSNDDGTTWTYVRYPTGTGSSYPRAIIAASDGYLYATEQQYSPEVGRIIRSNDGVNWTTTITDPKLFAATLISEPGDGYIYVGAYPYLETNLHLWRSSDGLNWNKICIMPRPGATGYWFYLILASDGYYYMAHGTSIAPGQSIWRSGDAFLWSQVYAFGDLGDNAPILEYSGNSCLYSGASNEIWSRCSSEWTVGRTETCEDEVFISNKDAEAQLTYMWVYDASLGTYTVRFPSTLPFDLLPNPMATGDIVYFGIESAVEDSGPFDNLIFDITRSAAGGFVVNWEYSDGGAGWPALNVTDGTASFVSTAVNSVHWVPPDETTAGGVWATEAVNGITAYWARARISNVVGTPIGPQQGNRDVYTCNWGRVDVDERQVPGDIPALLRIKFRNRSDENEYLVSDELDLLENRVICGLRSIDRGSSFTAYLNCSDEQNPLGVQVTAGTGTTLGDEIRAPTGRSAAHLTTGNGLTNYDTALTINLSTVIASEYYGIYHAYLRAQMYDPDPDEHSPSGDSDSVRVRLRIRSGSGGVSQATRYQQFAGWDKFDNGAGVQEEENYKDWQLLDFGQVNIPVTGLLKSAELPDETAIIVEVASDTGTLLYVDMYDVVLIPVDEWAGDFVDNALEDDSGIGKGYKLEVDSLAYPKRNIRALVRTIDASEFMRSVYQPITNGPAILQANVDQRLWFLTARGVYQGEHDGGDAHAHLHDSHADFIKAGVQVGMTVVNVTAGQTMVVTAVVSATQLNGTLTGADTWDDDDVYYIICPHWKSEPWNVHSIQLTGNSRYLSMRGDR